MAKQSGIFPIEGTMENVTFYKTADGFMVRKKGGVSKERIASDPAYARTRENNSQFGLNAKSGKLLRASIASMLKKGKDSRVSSRLTKIMGEVAKHDHVSVRGQKKAAVGLENMEAVALLKGFNFNNRAVMETVLSAVYTADMASGIVTISSMIPEEQINAPQGATHVGFRSGFVSVNFITGESQTEYSEQIQLPLNLTPATVTLDPGAIPNAGAEAKTMVVLLLEFYQDLDGIKYPLLNGAHNALSIIDIE